MKDVLRLLEAERQLERDLVAEAATLPAVATVWPTSLLMFHISAWRERLRNSLRQLQDGRPPIGPPENVDEFNNRELAEAANVSLEDAAGRAGSGLNDVIALWNAMGDRPFKWFTAVTTSEAVVRNSYVHPRNHIGEHFVERGARERGHRIFEETREALRVADAPAHVIALVKS